MTIPTTTATTTLMMRSRSSVRCSMSDMRASSAPLGHGSGAHQPLVRRGAAFGTAAFFLGGGLLGCARPSSWRAAFLAALARSSWRAACFLAGAVVAGRGDRPRSPGRWRRCVAGGRRAAAGASLARTLRRAATRFGSSAVSRALLHLVLEAGGHATQVAHRLADLAGGIGQALGPEHDQGDEQDDEDLATPDVEHGGRVYRRPPPAQARRRPWPRCARASDDAPRTWATAWPHLAEALQLQLQLSGGLARSRGASSSVSAAAAVTATGGHGPEQRHLVEGGYDASNQPSSCRRRWKSMRSSWVIGAPAAVLEELGGQRATPRAAPRRPPACRRCAARRA